MTKLLMFEVDVKNVTGVRRGGGRGPAQVWGSDSVLQWSSQFIIWHSTTSISGIQYSVVAPTVLGKYFRNICVFKIFVHIKVCHVYFY